MWVHALKIAALAPASSSLRATLRVGYPEHPHALVLRRSRSPERAARLCGNTYAWERIG